MRRITGLIVLGVLSVVLPGCDNTANTNRTANANANAAEHQRAQTVAALQPKGGEGFDFTPADQLEVRTADHFYHLGDLTLRWRQGTNGDWQNLSTAAARKPVLALPISSDTLAAADGNIARAARTAGKPRRAFYELMRKHGIHSGG